MILSPFQNEHVDRYLWIFFTSLNLWSPLIKKLSMVTSEPLIVTKWSPMTTQHSLVTQLYLLTSQHPLVTMDLRRRCSINFWFSDLSGHATVFPGDEVTSGDITVDACSTGWTYVEQDGWLPETSGGCHLLAALPHRSQLYSYTYICS